MSAAEEKNPKNVFLDALEQPLEAREEFVRQACGPDRDLARQVGELLSAHARIPRALADVSAEHGACALGVPDLEQLRPAFDQALRESPALARLDDLDVDVGDSFDGYELLRVVGDGGFGRVFLAEQREPVQRRVALKVLKLGMESRSVIARFEAERQTLALMEHAHIARVLDAGVTPSGRPYFAIEYVEGASITDFCRRAKLSLEPRLELFRDVCLAIQHAHAKGVLHRDIKPSNVLVAELDGRATPRVIDFGVAKAIGGDEREDPSVLTAEGHLIGTPAYMSPEQAGAAPDVDTRSDVYALGVLLYELLCDKLPLEPSGQGPSALLDLSRRIREEQPLAPSRTGSRAPGIRAPLPPELDWIALHCLEKERDRRYPTAYALALDVNRFLAGEPIEAAPPSRTYRMRKLARRHRAATLASAVALITLVAGVIGTSLGLLREARANVELDEALSLAHAKAAEARLSADVKSAVIDFLREDVLRAASPEGPGGRGRNLTVLEALEAAAESLESGPAGGGRLAQSPLVEAQVRYTIGQTYVDLGRFAEALEHFERSRELHIQELGPDAPDTLRTILATANVRLGMPHDESLLGELDAVQPRLERVFGPDSSERVWVQRLRGVALWNLGRYEQARAVYRQALGPAAEFGEPDDLLRIQSGLAIAEDVLGNGPEAARLFRLVVDSYSATKGPWDHQTLSAKSNLATCLRRAQRFEESRELLEEILAAHREIGGSLHPNTLTTIQGLGAVLRDLGRYEQSAVLLEEALTGSTRTLGPDHPLTLNTLTSLGQLRLLEEDIDAAEEHFREALERSETQLGPTHPDTLNRLEALAELLIEDGRNEGRELLEEWSRRSAGSTD